MTLATIIGSVCGLGRLKYGGLLAAVCAIPLVWALYWVGGFPLVVIATVSAGAKTIWAAPRMEGHLVSDRLTGQMLALWALSGGLWFAGVAPHIFPYPGWIGAFVMAQGLLWWCPAPIAWAARKGPLWDDVAAGGTAAVITFISAGISHGWLS